ncbi:MAG: hypothetical protein WD491_13725 [Balneolales bacterium]
MLFKDQPYYRKFESLLKELKKELGSLKNEKQRLLQENENLREKVNLLQNGSSGLFSQLSDDEKHLMRGEISDLINRIDKHISKDQ